MKEVKHNTLIVVNICGYLRYNDGSISWLGKSGKNKGS